MSAPVVDTSGPVSLGTAVSHDPNPLDLCFDVYDDHVPQRAVTERREIASYDDAPPVFVRNGQLSLTTHSPYSIPLVTFGAGRQTATSNAPSSDTPTDVTGHGQADVAPENEADAADVEAESTVRGDDTTATTPEAVDDDAAAGTMVGDDATAPDSEPASPRGVSTDETLRDSTQRAMAETAEQAGPEWERTNPYQEDDEKHPNDWTVQQGQPVTEQVISMAREDNCILARKLRRQGEHLRDLREERDTYEFTAEVYLNALDELMGERNRYRAALKEHDLLTEEEDALPDDGGISH